MPRERQEEINDGLQEYHSDKQGSEDTGVADRAELVWWLEELKEHLSFEEWEAREKRILELRPLVVAEEQGFKWLGESCELVIDDQFLILEILGMYYDGYFISETQGGSMLAYTSGDRVNQGQSYFIVTQPWVK